ncbi:uncharacterized protein SPPG_08842 [Spizellomyces punctatus DAOM BR117]|uniref:Nucleoside diphosphate kinase n=1 Tax=Spizellomyces punctatus (strain DAOM BR117) TaxID=645134 RepID=A0A0L0HV07_SPIPD|nr:uncharacterized protein SPPG_08842 [Spizellomyces punctatus DAOM BR117]KND04699.1 hypothetical protein SPPG_08842 [Spizellomyces punctatus DAOM BR117]|eukprot:XP_016612738.1 hypothetical protein SPPG_08842 [Spizellomyces punctatus DAOM BR117]
MERNFLLLKPDTSSNEPAIVYTLKQAGFKVFNRRRTILTSEQASEFYKEWRDDPDFGELIVYMTSGPVVALALHHYTGFEVLRKLVGPLDPAVAKTDEPESLRAKYATDELRNGFHMSETKEAVEKDLSFFFPDTHVVPLPTPEDAKLILETTVYPVLLQGLTQLCKEKPANPTAWLGTWLLDNNPNKPKVEEPPEVVV